MIKRGGSAVMAKEELPECPVATAVSLIGGKWKLLIIRNLRERPWRFNELRRDLEGISQKVLTDSLRQMEDDGLVFRHDYGENPPRVEYGLTELGRQMMPVIDSLADFGVYYKAIVVDAALRGGAKHGGEHELPLCLTMVKYPTIAAGGLREKGHLSLKTSTFGAVERE